MLALVLVALRDTLFPTLRPLAGSVNVNVTLAAVLRLKENVVPIGGAFSSRSGWS